MRRSRHLLLSSLLLAAVTPLHAGQSALGPQGEIYRVRAADAALMFEVHRPGAGVEREIVPTTEGQAVESNPTLVFEEQTGSAFLLWQTMASNAFPVLNLSHRTTSGWSPVIALTGNPYAFKSAPQLVITRDASNLSSGVSQRTVIHVAWAEEDGNGFYDTFYTPLILENGAFIGRNVVYRVRAFDRLAAAGVDIEPGLLSVPRLQPGSDANSVRMIFGNLEKGRVDMLEVRVLARSLVALGDGARAHIIGADRKLDPKTLTNIAAAASAYVLEAKHELRPAIVRALADEVSSFILGWKPSNGGPEALAGGARAHIIGVGSDFGGGLRNITAAPGVVDEIAASGDGPAHVLRFTLTSSRPAPSVGKGDAYAMFSARDGNEATVSWVHGNRLSYRESAGPGWGPERVLELDGDFTLDAALAMLAERTAGR